MILRLTNQTLVLAILSCAATICASPAGADAVDQSVNSAAVEIGRSGPQAQKTPSDATTSVGNPVLAIPLSKLSMTRDRPIFSPSRRPPTVAAPPVMARPVEPAKPAAPENPPLVLVGTVAGEDSGIAVFVEQASENTVRLRINEKSPGMDTEFHLGTGSDAPERPQIKCARIGATRRYLRAGEFPSVSRTAKTVAQTLVEPSLRPRTIAASSRAAIPAGSSEIRAVLHRFPRLDLIAPRRIGREVTEGPPVTVLSRIGFPAGKQSPSLARPSRHHKTLDVL